MGGEETGAGKGKTLVHRQPQALCNRVCGYASPGGDVQWFRQLLQPRPGRSFECVVRYLVRILPILATGVFHGDTLHDRWLFRSCEL